MHGRNYDYFSILHARTWNHTYQLSITCSICFCLAADIIAPPPQRKLIPCHVLLGGGGKIKLVDIVDRENITFYVGITYF
jgi:hypothetical protein